VISKIQSECIELLQLINDMKEFGCSCDVMIGFSCTIHLHHRRAIALVLQIEMKSLNDGWTCD